MPLSNAASYDVVGESFEGSLSQMVALLNQTRAKPVTAERFEWLYRRNPDGPAVIWSVRQGQTGEMVGFTACLPRRILVDGQLHTCWNGADFSVAPRYRTLGPAVKLRRAARLGIEAGRADFLYAHPNNRLAEIHRLVGHEPVGSMIRLVRPLQLGAYIGDRLHSPRIGGLAGAVLDPLYRLGCRETWRRPCTDVRFVPNVRFDGRFDELFERHVHRRRVLGVRDAAYLTWRYGQNPQYATDSLLVEHGERLAGYLLFMEAEGRGMIKDVFPADAPDLVASLLQAAVRTGWSLGWRSLSIGLLEQSPLLPVLHACGFRLRSDRTQMFAFAPANAGWRDAVYSPACWFLNSGDRDV